jgi:hypothetical protein
MEFHSPSFMASSALIEAGREVSFMHQDKRECTGNGRT